MDINSAMTHSFRGEHLFYLANLMVSVFHVMLKVEDKTFGYRIWSA